MPSNYAGEVWPDFYVFLARHRDSDCLANSNFEKGLEAIGGERTDEETDSPLVTVVRESHWAVGWVEWIAIQADESDTLRKADEIAAALESYPVLDDSDFSEREQTEADETWERCYDVKERVAYVRSHRSQFKFQDLADMLGCIRGKYFAGYASELIA